MRVTGRAMIAPELPRHRARGVLLRDPGRLPVEPEDVHRDTEANLLSHIPIVAE